MKTPLSLALGSALCLLLTSCVVTSDNPLSSPDAAHADQALVGDWLGKKDQDTFHFSVKNGPWMHVEIIPAKAGDKGDSYDLFPTVIGNTTFLNVVMIGKDDQGHPTKSYVFVRYLISSDNVLQMWMMSQDAAAAAVRAGKLKGIVHQDKSLMVGQPPHPDVDVTLLDTSANIVKFIQSADVTALFSEEREPLYRVKPVGK
jgi:hypothetical protein